MKDAQDKHDQSIAARAAIEGVVAQTQIGIMLLMLQPHKLLLMLYQQAMLNLKRVLNDVRDSLLR